MYNIKNNAKSKMKFISRVGLILAALSFVPSSALAKVKITDEHVAICEGAARYAERQYDLPDDIMHGIVRAESSSYPWVINFKGKGEFFASKEEAIARVKALQEQGYASVDVGCAQVNLYWHPDAFDSLAEAFDPISNLDYAARHLKDLKENQKFSQWRSAVGMYHSGKRNSARGRSYARTVYRLIETAPPRLAEVYNGYAKNGGRTMAESVDQEASTPPDHSLAKTRIKTEHTKPHRKDRDLSIAPFADFHNPPAAEGSINDFTQSMFDMDAFLSSSDHGVNNNVKIVENKVSQMMGVIGNMGR